MNDSSQDNNLKCCLFGTELRKFKKNEHKDEEECENCFLIEEIASSISNRNTIVLGITVIDLPNCNLKSLPTLFRCLPLKKLNLSKNQFTMVPVCLYNGLENLEVLDLSQNLIEQFDIAPDCCTSLKILKLNQNRFNNPPKWILEFCCLQLEEFDYSINLSRSYKLSKLNKLTKTKLEKLHLRSCSLLSQDYPYLKSIPSLKYLDLSNDFNVPNYTFLNEFNNFDELFVKPTWNSMEVLVLNNLTLSFFPEGIMWVESLRELYLTHNCLSWVPDGIEYLINLEILDLSNNEISVTITQITQLPKLKILCLANNKLQSFPNVDNLPNLQTLDLYENCLTEFNSDIKRLKKIDLECNYFPTSDLEAFSEYTSRMLALRADAKDSRFCGHKEESQHESTSNSLTDDENAYDNCTSEPAVIPEENWDDPEPIRASHCTEITPSDDEWQGETLNCNQSQKKPSEKVYIDEEEWWYIDAD